MYYFYIVYVFCILMFILNIYFIGFQDFTCGNSQLKCIYHTPWRHPIEGWNISEWHSVNKVVFITYVCISQFFMCNSEYLSFRSAVYESRYSGIWRRVAG
jgi:hypothetical protein